MSLLDSYINLRDKLEKYETFDGAWLPRWARWLSYVCAVVFGIGACAIYLIMGADENALWPLWLLMPFAFIAFMVSIVDGFYPIFCGFRMIRIGRKVAKKLAKEWIRDQPFCSLRDYEKERWKTYVRFLNIECGMFDVWTVWIGFYLDRGFSNQDFIQDKPSIYTVVFDRDFNIIAVTQHQESPYTGGE